MTEQTVKEIIKSFAYGLSAKEISDNEGTSLENYAEIRRGARSRDRTEESGIEGRWMV